MNDISTAITSFLPQFTRALDLYEQRLAFEMKRDVRITKQAEDKEETKTLKAEIKALKALLPKEAK